MNEKRVRIGVVGTGFIAKGIISILQNHEKFYVSVVRSRRTQNENFGFNNNLITDSDSKLIEESDIIIECSGNPIYATTIVRKILESNKPVVTMDAELQITTGSFLQSLGGYFTEAEGDQPGCLAALNREVTTMGFLPIVYGNIKGFLNENPTEEEMRKWSIIQGISIEQVTSFTDGTKVAIEQVLVANGLGADLADEGLIGGKKIYDGFDQGVIELANFAEKRGITLSDYIMCTNTPSLGRRKASHGVFIIGKHNVSQERYLEYYKMGAGPYYLFEKPYHLCHMEVIKTLYDVIEKKPPLLNNSFCPKYSVSAIAKRNLKVGESIKRGIGSFDVRGEAVSIASDQDHVPIGLMFDVIIKKPIQTGQTIHFEDIYIEESEALHEWQNILKRTLASEKQSLPL